MTEIVVFIPLCIAIINFDCEIWFTQWRLESNCDTLFPNSFVLIFFHFRCQLHAILVGICTALPTGAAAAIAILAENVGSLVGVAISVSLLPPAVNAVIRCNSIKTKTKCI